MNKKNESQKDVGGATNVSARTLPAWKKKRWWVFGILAIFLFWIYSIPRFPFESIKLYSGLSEAEIKNKISIQSLATQNTHPYLNLDPPPLHLQPALKKYPDAVSCLTATAQKQVHPDLRLVDWDKLRNVGEVKICLWRVFTSISKEETIVQWMNFHGYETHIIESDLKVTGKRKIINGTLLYENNKPVWPTTGLQRFVHLISNFSNSSSLSVTLKDGKVISVYFNSVNYL